MWFLIALIGYFLLAVVFILDKLIVDKSVNKPVVYTFYSTIFLLALLLAYPFGVELLFGLDWFWALFSGLAFGFGLWTVFIAVKEGEATHIYPFNGAFITIFVYILSYTILFERLTRPQLAGILILVFATLLLSFEKSKKHKGFHIGFVWAMLAGLLFAASHVSAKYLYEGYGFFTGLVWSKSTVGLVGLITLFFPSVRALFKKKKRKKSKSYARKHAGAIIVSNKVLGVASNFLIQYAIAIGSVTLVGAMSGLQFAIMFVMVLLLTKYLPKLFKEYFTRRELIVETIAIVLVVVGSALFVL
jgi:drug/metabolite transporter (DMT)-like permease